MKFCPNLPQYPRYFGLKNKEKAGSTRRASVNLKGHVPQTFTQICRVFGGFLCAHLKWSSGDHSCLSKSQVTKPSVPMPVTRPPCGWILSHRKQKTVCTHFPVLKLDPAKSQGSQSSLRWDCKLCSLVWTLPAPTAAPSSPTVHPELSCYIMQVVPLLCQIFLSIADSPSRAAAPVQRSQEGRWPEICPLQQQELVLVKAAPPRVKPATSSVVWNRSQNSPFLERGVRITWCLR